MLCQSIHTYTIFSARNELVTQSAKSIHSSTFIPKDFSYKKSNIQFSLISNKNLVQSVSSHFVCRLNMRRPQTKHFSSDKDDLKPVSLVSRLKNLLSTVEEYTGSLEKASVSFKTLEVPEEAFMLLKKYRKKLHFMSVMSNVEGIVKSSHGVDSLEPRHVYKNEILKLVTNLKLENDIKCFSIPTIPDAQSGETYHSSPENFKGKTERHLIIVNVVSEKFPEYHIRTVQQLVDACRLDSEVDTYARLIRSILSELQSMPPELLQAGISRPMYQEYLQENKQMKQVNFIINKVMDDSSKVFQALVEATNQSRQDFINGKGDVLKISKMTQDLLPRMIKARIISEGLSKKEQASAFYDALSYYKSVELYKLSNTPIDLKVNKYFNDDLYKSDDPSTLKTDQDFLDEDDDDKTGGSSGSSSASSPDISTLPTSKEHLSPDTET